MSLFITLARLEGDDNLHQARLLILLRAFSGGSGEETVDGLTKLAKLDFLLRYPVYLERALEAKNRSTREVQVSEHERKSIESSMVRYHYGPWDHRYRRFINLLVARGLAEVGPEGRTLRVGLTGAGRDAAERLASDERFEDVARRAKVLYRDFNQRGTHLMRFIYSTFPEVVSLRMGEEIE